MEEEVEEEVEEEKQDGGMCMYLSPGQATRCIRLERRTKNSRSSVAVAAWRVDLTLHRAQGDWLTLLLLLPYHLS